MNLIQPRFCTQNWTCEIERSTSLQCNAQTHKIDRMKVFKVDCIDLDDCYRKKTNQTYLQEFLIDLLEEDPVDAGGGGVKQQDEPDKSYIHSESRTTIKPRLKDNPALGGLVNRSDIDSYVFDRDERPQLSPVNYDRVESLDSGLTWAFKTMFVIRRVHLIVCVAQNEIGDAIVTKIIIPSALYKGRLAEVVMLNERDMDKEVVQGDNLNLEFSFNNIFYE